MVEAKKELAEARRLLEEQRTLVADVENERQGMGGKFQPAIKEAFHNALDQVALLNPRVDLSCTAFNYIVKDGALHSFNAMTNEWEPVYVPTMSSGGGEDIGPFQQGMPDKGAADDPKTVPTQDM